MPNSTSNLDCAGKLLDLTIVQVMGILNVTPDSFSDGGCYNTLDAALFRAEQMISEGATIIDVGGESSRPGALPVSVQEELDRVIPVIEALRDCPIPISIDTTKKQVMQAAIGAGAGLVNDVNALQEEGALSQVAQTKASVCLVHRRGSSATMQCNPVYTEVAGEVSAFLRERAAACIAAGISKNRLVVDPGIGFGKNLAHNLSLLRSLSDLTALGFPVLLGASRKAMLGELLNKPPMGRLAGNLAVAAFAIIQGVKILRVHDVAATCDVIRVMAQVLARPQRVSESCTFE